MIIPLSTLYLIIKEMKSFLKLTQYTITVLLTLEKLTMGSLFSVGLPSYGCMQEVAEHKRSKSHKCDSRSLST